MSDSKFRKVTNDYKLWIFFMLYLFPLVSSRPSDAELAVVMELSGLRMGSVGRLPGLRLVRAQGHGQEGAIQTTELLGRL